MSKSCYDENRCGVENRRKRTFAVSDGSKARSTNAQGCTFYEKHVFLRGGDVLIATWTKSKILLAILPAGANSGITKNSVNKTVRGDAAELLSEARSDEFNESSVHEKVFSCFIVAGELFGYFLAIQKVT
jgi:hypothetical protein